MSGDDLHQRYIAALALANEAAALASSYFQDRARMGTKMKGFQDFVTEADGAVEDLLRRRIAKAFPADGFLGEEGGGSNNDNLWIVAVSRIGPFRSASCDKGCRKLAS
jgi:myo-inositol-1(or 4)-monophosphatase